MFFEQNLRMILVYKTPKRYKRTPIPNFHSERECSRRRRQIANSQLTKANGLA